MIGPLSPEERRNSDRFARGIFTVAMVAIVLMAVCAADKEIQMLQQFLAALFGAIMPLIVEFLTALFGGWMGGVA